MKTPLHHDEVHLRDYLYILKKRRLLIFSFAILLLSAGILFTFQEKVLYQASATILIERENPNIVDFKEVMSFDASSSDYYQTQYQMLKSRTLIESLIQKENLEQDPYLVGAGKGILRKSLSKYQEALPPWLQGFLAKKPLTEVFVSHMLHIEPMRNSRLVSVSVEHPDPVRSAELTNRLIELYIQRNLQERFSISERASELLSQQLIELKERVAEAERNLQRYKEKHGLTNIPSIREKDAFLQEAKLELVKLQTEESKLSKRYLPAHPQRISIRSQIEGLSEKIKEEDQKSLELSRVAIEYSQLERESETSRKIYESLLARQEETQSAAQTQSSNIMIVDRAVPPTRPFKPRPLVNIMVALFVGVVGGVLLAFFIEYLDPTVRIPDDIEKAVGLEVLGIIPKVGKGWRKGPAKGDLFVASKKPSTAAESFRALRTALLFKTRTAEGARILLVTSANPSEGKSTVSLNLAGAFQQNHLKVLLIDADLRKPKLHRLFEVAPEKGVSDILEKHMPLSEAVRSNIEGQGFDLLTSGTHSHHPTEILGSETMREFIDHAKSIYDVIVIDSPPFHAVADVAVLNEYAHAVIVVAKYHSTHRRHLKDVKRMFSDGKKVVGVVINQVSVRERDYYYHQYYYYGYGDARGTK